MSIKINDNFRISAPKLVDDRTLKEDGTPYSSKAEVLTTIIASRRALGLIVLIGTDFYYFKTGTTSESHLQPLTISGGVQSVTGGIVDNTDPLNPVVIFTPENYDLLQFSNASSNPFVRLSGLEGKVDKVTGYGLSQQNYTSAEKTKLAGIENNAQVNSINFIKRNGVTLPIDPADKSVNIVVDDAPTTYKNIITDGEFSVEELSENSGYIYRIENQEEENLSWEINEEVFDFGDHLWESGTVEPLGLGVEKRIDAVYYSETGTIETVKGSQTEVSYPSVPVSAILRTFIILTEGGVIFENSKYVEKKDLEWHVYSSNFGTTLLTAIRKNTIFTGIGTEQERSILGTHNTPEYDGAVYSMYFPYNTQGINKVIHNASDTNVSTPYLFQNEEDYTVQPGELLTFKYSEEIGAYILESSNLPQSDDSNLRYSKIHYSSVVLHESDLINLHTTPINLPLDLQPNEYVFIAGELSYIEISGIDSGSGEIELLRMQIINENDEVLASHTISDLTVDQKRFNVFNTNASSTAGLYNPATTEMSITATAEAILTNPENMSIKVKVAYMIGEF